MIKLNDTKEFGQFISEKRKRRSMSVQELAQSLHISTAYMSQLEYGVRTNPDIEILERLSKQLMLNAEEYTTLLDLYAAANDTVSPDIAEYIKKSSVVSKALRIALKYSASDKDWLEFIDRLKNEQ